MKGFATISIGIGNIGIGNTSTLATLNKDLGRKCFRLYQDGRGRNSRHQEVGFWIGRGGERFGIIFARKAKPNDRERKPDCYTRSE